jgi:hypothetical protein
VREASWILSEFSVISGLGRLDRYRLPEFSRFQFDFSIDAVLQATIKGSIVTLFDRSDATPYGGNDASVLGVMTVSISVPEQNMSIMSIDLSDSQNLKEKRGEQLDVLKSPIKIPEPKVADEAILRRRGYANDINSTTDSGISSENVTASNSKQHSVAPPSPNDDEILSKGTPVHCERINKAGTIYSDLAGRNSRNLMVRLR